MAALFDHLISPVPSCFYTRIIMIISEDSSPCRSIPSMLFSDAVRSASSSWARYGSSSTSSTTRRYSRHWWRTTTKISYGSSSRPLERGTKLSRSLNAGFDYPLVEDLRPFVVKISRYSKYAPLLKNSISFMETADWRIFLMQDSAAVAEALRLGAEPYQGDYASLTFK